MSIRCEGRTHRARLLSAFAAHTELRETRTMRRSRVSAKERTPGVGRHARGVRWIGAEPLLPHRIRPDVQIGLVQRSSIRSSWAAKARSCIEWFSIITRQCRKGARAGVPPSNSRTNSARPVGLRQPRSEIRPSRCRGQTNRNPAAASGPSGRVVAT